MGKDALWRFILSEDILEESWVVREYQLQAKIKFAQKMLFDFIQMRFPEMLEVAKKYIKGITNLEVLCGLILKIGPAHSMNDVMAALMEIPESSKLEEPVVEH